VLVRVCFVPWSATNLWNMGSVLVLFSSLFREREVPALSGYRRLSTECHEVEVKVVSRELLVL